jgi:hypothetical protein
MILIFFSKRLSFSQIQQKKNATTLSKLSIIKLPFKADHHQSSDIASK